MAPSHIDHEMLSTLPEEDTKTKVEKDKQLSKVAVKRINKDVKAVITLENANFDISPTVEEPANMLKWMGTIKGAPGTPYEGGIFNYRLYFPTDYPFKPPEFKFTTPVFHPGINGSGQICVPILGNDWKPDKTVFHVLSDIWDKLNNPSADDPFEPDRAKLLQESPKEFNSQAKEWTKKYADPQVIQDDIATDDTEITVTPLSDMQ